MVKLPLGGDKNDLWADMKLKGELFGTEVSTAGSRETAKTEV